MQQIARRAPWKRFAQLLPSPDRGGMRRDVDVEDPAPIVREDDEDEQHTTGDRRHREEVDGHQRAHVVLQERAPRLGGWAAPSWHEPRDRALGDLEAEFPEFAVDAWGAPQRVGRRHLADQAPQLLVDRRPPAGPPRAACPLPCESAAVPADDRRGADDHEGRRPVRPYTPEPSPNHRSVHRRAGLGRRRRHMANCCRNATFSSATPRCPPKRRTTSRSVRITGPAWPSIARWSRARSTSATVRPQYWRTTADTAAGRVHILAARRQLGYAVRDALLATGVVAHSFFNEQALDGNQLEACQAQGTYALMTLLAEPEDRVALRCWCGSVARALRRRASEESGRGAKKLAIHRGRSSSVWWLSTFQSRTRAGLAHRPGTAARCSLRERGGPGDVQALQHDVKVAAHDRIRRDDLADRRGQHPVCRYRYSSWTALPCVSGRW